jgi:hypothetical protein
MDTMERATLARSFFETAKRDNGVEYYRTTDDAPEWVSPLLCRAAHGGMLPDDYRYQFIVDALDILSETDDDDEIAERLDGDVNVYYAGQAAWLASHIERFGYCEDAAKEYGMPEPFNLSALLMMGQLAERREVLDAVRAFLADMDDA